jgi:hypothetical protein
MTTINEEHARLLEVGLRLRRRSEWGAQGDYTNPRTVDEPADHQFIHISVTNPGNYSSNDAHVRAIEAIGRFRFPATGISYNRLILPGGFPYEGQPIGRRGAHTVNDDQRATCNTSGCPSFGRSLTGPDWNLNYNARAYVMARNCGDSVTSHDIDAMARCLAGDRLAGFVKRTATLHGHRCCSDKSCPCDPTWGLMDDIETRMNYYLNKGNVKVDLEDDVTQAEIDEIVSKVLAGVPDAVWKDSQADDGGNSANPAFTDAPDGINRHKRTLLNKIRGDVSTLVQNSGSGPGGSLTLDDVRAVVREELDKTKLGL